MTKSPIYYALILFSIIGCSTSKSTFIPETKVFEYCSVGNCVYAVFDPTDKNVGDKKRSLIIELIPPTYEQIDTLIDPKSIIVFPGDQNAYYLDNRKAHEQFVFSTDEMGRYLDQKQTNGAIICKAKVPMAYQKYSKEELVALNYTIPYYRIIAPSKVRMRYVNRPPENKLKPSERFFKSGYWTGFQSTHHGRVGFRTMPMLKKAVIALGYRLKDDDLHDEVLDAAIKDIQRKNGLPADGRLDAALLEVLGIKY